MLKLQGSWRHVEMARAPESSLLSTICQSGSRDRAERTDDVEPIGG